MKFVSPLFVLCLSSFFCSLAFAQKITLPATEVPLLNKSVASCGHHEPLLVNLGKPRIEWSPVGPQSRYKVLFVAVKLSSPGLEDINIRRNFSNESLNCVLLGKSGSDEVVLTPDQSQWTFFNNIIVGGLLPEDEDLLLPIDGLGSIEIYGLMQTPGEPDQPLSMTTQFQFFWTSQNPLPSANR